MQHKLGFGKVLAEYDKAIKKYFSDMRVIHGEEARPVPVIWGTEDRVDSLLNDNSVMPQKIALPQISLCRKDLYRGSSRWRVEYQLTFRTLYQSDMDQLLEQLIMRFTPHAECDADNLGELELEISKVPRVESNTKGQVNLHRSDWLIGTEVKR